MTKSTKDTSINIREIILGILIEVMENEQYSSTVISNTLTKYQYLDKQDRSFLTRLSEGVIERVIELDYIINQFSKIKTNKMKPVIRNLLRMGAYQIKYMEQVPASAACNEAVKLAKKKGFQTLSGFVNGILRTISRNLDEIKYPDEKKDSINFLSTVYSMPEWLIRLWMKEYDYETVKLMVQSSMEEKPLTIRINTDKITEEELERYLLEEGISVIKGNYLPYARILKGYNYLNKISAFREGKFQVQDESSMLVAQAAGIKKNDHIIDVCAAPGGKSLHAAQLLQGTGLVSARDLSESKVYLIRENITRMGYQNIETMVHDATILRNEDKGKADVVIADLPCSGLGVIGKKPDIKYKMNQEQMEDLAKLQRGILSVVWEYVKEDGVLIYSTCTVNKMENMENVEWFIKEYPFELESLNPYLPKELYEESTELGFLQLIPGIHKSDGFFLARLRRKAK